MYVCWLCLKQLIKYPQSHFSQSEHIGNFIPTGNVFYSTCVPSLKSKGWLSGVQSLLKTFDLFNS